jgi:transcriptional regulator with XRE-family HTH domain
MSDWWDGGRDENDAAGSESGASQAIEGFDPKAVERAGTVRVDYATEHIRDFEDTVIRNAELYQASLRAAALPVRPPIELEPPDGWRHPVTGRRELAPIPTLIPLGRYLRRARYIVDLSQERLAGRSGVSQPMISRAERGLAPSMGIDRLAQLGEVFGRAFPLGFCPHEHACGWQPIKPPPEEQGSVQRLIALIEEGRRDRGDT